MSREAKVSCRARYFERSAEPRDYVCAVYLSGDCADTPRMITAAVVAKAAALGGLRASLTAILLPLRNRASAFRVCAFVLDCFGHQISPCMLFDLPFFDAKALKKVKASGAEYPEFRPASENSRPLHCRTSWHSTHLRESVRHGSRI